MKEPARYHRGSNRVNDGRQRGYAPSRPPGIPLKPPDLSVESLEKPEVLPPRPDRDTQAARKVVGGHRADDDAAAEEAFVDGHRRSLKIEEVKIGDGGGEGVAAARQLP